MPREGERDQQATAWLILLMRGLRSLVTYLLIGFYAAFMRPLDAARFEQARVLLALMSFVVNVITI